MVCHDIDYITADQITDCAGEMSNKAQDASADRHGARLRLSWCAAHRLHNVSSSSRGVVRPDCRRENTEGWKYLMVVVIESSA